MVRIIPAMVLAKATTTVTITATPETTMKTAEMARKIPATVPMITITAARPITAIPAAMATTAVTASRTAIPTDSL